MRVVSLVPSSTETLLALGADVVACTRFCEQPGIEQVGGTKNPDVAAIASLGPDLVVLDREENRLEDHDALVAAGLTVLVTDVRTVGDALDAVETLATAVGRPAPRRPALPESGASRLHAFVPIWRRPWMTIGPDTYGASLLARLGVAVTPVVDGVDYPEVDLALLTDAAPGRHVDVVLVPSEPYEFGDDHLGELSAVAPVERIDGRDLFWWGIRTPGALERLAARLRRSGTALP